MTKTMR